MAESENESMREAQTEPLTVPAPNATSESSPGAMMVPTETVSEEPTPSAVVPYAADSPFRDDQLLFFEGAQIRNELADAQADPEAARSLAARHWSRLFYDPMRPWRGQTPYPQVSLPKPDKQTP
jgi:hypothetical protein